MTFKTRLAALAGATALSAAVVAPASAAVTISGSVTDISFRNVDPGLVIEATPLAPFSFSLANIGDFQDVAVLNVGTGESSVDLDDIFPFGISATFGFASPVGTSGSPVGGSTFGYIVPGTSCGFRQGGCGAVVWGAPSVFNFGNGGQFSVELFDASFGTPGGADVTGRFTLLSNSVPEPATWAMMIIGFGAVGGAMRRRQRTAVRYNFA